ncbi:MAG: hypothetical protein KDB23_18140 [Planctomycetales bacterium]|nr:hypothetical protein [Planctomycetales bacterium]
MANSNSTRTSPATSESWLWRPSSLLAILVTSICIMIPAVILFGRVQGTEFCPQTFELRRYSFFRLPFTDLQVTPVSRDYRTSGFIAQLRSDAYVSRLSSGTRWDVVEVYDGGQHNSGMADVLVSYLEPGPDRVSTVWSTWSDDHPHLAQRFWPIVQRAVIANGYALLPALFDFAARTEETADDTKLAEFSAELQRVLVAEATGLARDTAAAGERTEARRLYELVLAHGETPAARTEYAALGGVATVGELQAEVEKVPLVVPGPGKSETDPADSSEAAEVVSPESFE